MKPLRPELDCPRWELADTGATVFWPFAFERLGKSKTMKAKDLMTLDCRTCTADDSVEAAASVMSKQNLGCLPVAENDRLVGMITDRDIVTRGVAEGKDLSVIRVGELMSGKVYYCFEDQNCEEVAQNMGKLQVRRMPIMNKEKKLVGILSLGDLSTRSAQKPAGDALEAISTD